MLKDSPSLTRLPFLFFRFASLPLRSLHFTSRHVTSLRFAWQARGVMARACSRMPRPRAGSDWQRAINLRVCLDWTAAAWACSRSESRRGLGTSSDAHIEPRTTHAFLLDCAPCARLHLTPRSHASNLRLDLTWLPSHAAVSPSALLPSASPLATTPSSPRLRSNGCPNATCPNVTCPNATCPQCRVPQCHVTQCHVTQ